MLFLIRDWYYEDEQQFGYVGGQTYLDEILEVKEDQHADLSVVREYIKSSFETLTCFLMPPPGNYAVSKSNFALIKCDPEFIQQLKVLIPSLLGPKNIVIKKFNNKFLDGADLYECIKIFVESFKPNDQLPEPQSIFSLTVERSMTNLIEKCLNNYQSLVKLEDVSGLKSPAHIYLLHSDSKAAALEQFSSNKKMGSQNDHKHYSEILDKKIEAEFDDWRDIAITLLELITYCFTEYKTNIAKEHFFDLKTVEDTQRVHQTHRYCALDSYKLKEKPGTSHVHNAFLKNLENYIQAEYESWSGVVLNLQSVVKACLTQYSIGIKNEEVSSYKTEQDLDKVHDKYKKVAYEQYDKSVKKGTQNEQDLFKQNLQEEINIEYLNWRKYMSVLIQRVEEGMKYYQSNTTKKILKALNTPGDVHKHHSSQKRICMDMLELHSLAPKDIQEKFKSRLDAELEKMHEVWKDETIERIHRKNSRKCFCI